MELTKIFDGIERVKMFLKGKVNEEVLGFDPVNLDKFVARREHDDLILLNYTDRTNYELKPWMWSNFLRVCRGIVFDKDGNLISFPFHKFFNLNEVQGETDEGTVAKWKIKSITEKVDGVLIQVFRYKGEFIFGSRHGIMTTAATIARELSADNIETLFKHLGGDHYTVLLELIHPEVWKPGMIDYGNLKVLVPLAVRDLKTFQLYSSIETFPRNLPSPFVLPMEYVFPSLWDVKVTVKNAVTPDFEGFVIQGEGNLGNDLVKVKSLLYLDRVSAVRGMTARRILRNYEEGGLEQVDNFVAGYEEIIKIKKLDQLIFKLRELETTLRGEIQTLKDKPIEEIPQHLRWIKSYPEGSPKWEQSLRKTVTYLLEKVGERSGEGTVGRE